MPQRPTIRKPVPLTSPDPAQNGADPIMGGVNLPKFSADMQAEISPEAAPLWNFVLRNAKRITAAVVACVVLILAVAGWQWYAETQLEKSRSALGQALSIQDPARRVTALESYVKDAPSELIVAAELEIAAASVAVQNYDRAAEAYASVAAREGDSPLGFTARMNRAQVLMQGGKYAEARSEFQALVSKAPAQLASVMNQQAAEAAEAAGDKAGAIAAYEAAMNALPPTDSETAQFFRARIAQLKK
ncbi:tetratricopeptide repeat protein [uncultured Mailhella sp.]|uniref:tetratricopeptide repeat protein n=1 Tax=uncultured Mailhella sp. TaxID=1981031 RepID=UPI0026038210|nr:tetratricopeptide repeat protein [uncultured Mailhella sp.]